MATTHHHPSERRVPDLRGCKQLVDYLLYKVLDPKYVEAFTYPVNPDDVPDYHIIIKNPICFAQVIYKLQKGKYSSPQEFTSDVKLFFDNCLRYNGSESPLGQVALRAESAFRLAWPKLPCSAEAPLDPPRTVRTASANRSAAPARRPVKKRQDDLVVVRTFDARKMLELRAAMEDETVMTGKMDEVVAILRTHGELPPAENGEADLDFE